MSDIEHPRALSTVVPKFDRVTLRPGWAFISVLIVLVSGILASIQPPDPQPDQPASEKSFAEWLLYPVEQYPSLRLPKSPNYLQATCFARDQLNGFAVGGGGTILHTNDGGISWTGQDSRVTSGLVSIACDGTGRRAWAVGDAGTIVTTDTAGARWLQVVSLTHSRLLSIFFAADGVRGWIAGRDGLVLLTTDGGKTWSTQPTPTKKALLSIHFLPDGMTGWAVGFDGIVIDTADGGRSWRRRKDGGSTLSSIAFSDDGTLGLAVGFDDTVFVIKNRGQTWAPLDRQVVFDRKDRRWLNAVYMTPNGDRAWVVADDGSILHSSDRTQSWVSQSSGTATALYGIRFDPSGTQGWAVGSVGQVLTSSNGGKKWVTRLTSNASILNTVHFFPDGRKGWAAGGAGVVLATLDGGRVWHLQSSGTDSSLSSIVFNGDGLRGWAVGDGGTIIATTDGGKTWRPRPSGTTVPLTQVAFLNDGLRGWAVGSGGVILRTNNAGREWRRSTLIGAPWLNSIYFDSNGMNGWAAATEGKIFRTTNQGETWVGKVIAGSAALSDVRFFDDNIHGIAVGEGGLIFTTEDGDSWTARNSTTAASLNAVRYGKSYREAWIAGDHGTILVTADGGLTWAPRSTKVGSGLTAISVGDDSKSGWAVGYPPSLLKTTNGAETWEPVAWPLRNKRYPAPWFWLSLIPAVLLLRRSVRIDLTPATAGVEALGMSDAPVNDFSRDRLQFTPLARGISRFLRNVKTSPPFTIAVSGDWGSGKSTLMELVCADLRRYGTRPVWFNAWHHQRDAQLLGALLAKIRSQGLPPAGSFDGMAFRARLLILRARKYYFATGIAILALAVFAYFGTSNWEALWNFIHDTARYLYHALQGSKAQDPALPPSVASDLVKQLLSAVAALLSLSKGLTAFKVNPGNLLSTAVGKLRLKDIEALTDFRSKFAEQFDEVTAALPYTMVIVIDDLDRCQPESVVTVMEAVNFLVSSGKCFVILGMSTQRVEAAVAVAFRRIADELSEQMGENTPAKAREVRLRQERERRQRYAKEYLGKLINLEVVVPNRSDIPSYLLFETPNERVNRKEIAAQVLEFWPSWIAALALLCGLVLGFTYSFPTKPRDGIKIELGATAVIASNPVSQDTLSSTPSTGAPRPAETTTYVPTVQERTPVELDRWLAGLALLLVVGGVGGVILYRLRSESYAVRDSTEYRSALHLWMPLFQQSNSTPRAIKRFGNKLRYLAMLQQPTLLDETGFDLVRHKIVTMLKFKRAEDKLPNSRPDMRDGALNEPMLVALACLNEVLGPDWKERLPPSGSTQFDLTIQQAIEQQKSSNLAAWPPAQSDLAAFEHLIRGIKLAT